MIDQDHGSCRGLQWVGRGTILWAAEEVQKHRRPLVQVEQVEQEQQGVSFTILQPWQTHP